ncbi:MAG: hypothetical protein M1282_09365 [Chloroflexi bacterium]|nr:hypothetical protein [Chloroflexota bacterium]
MNFFKSLFGGSSPAPQTNFYTLNVKCNRCGEVIEGRVNLANDLSLEEDNNYFVRKVLMGSGHCFQQIEIELKFDASKKVIEKQASGGTFVE